MGYYDDDDEITLVELDDVQVDDVDSSMPSDCCFWCNQLKDPNGNPDNMEVMSIQPCKACEDKWKKMRESGRVVILEYTKNPHNYLKDYHTYMQIENIKQMCEVEGLGDNVLTGAYGSATLENFDKYIARTLTPEKAKEAREIGMMFMEDKLYNILLKKGDNA